MDEHHTIEDVGIAPGEAFYKALGNKKGVAIRLPTPMDDCLAQISISSPLAGLERNIPAEFIGDMPTEMCMHSSSRSATTPAAIILKPGRERAPQDGSDLKAFASHPMASEKSHRGKYPARSIITSNMRTHPL